MEKAISFILSAALAFCFLATKKTFAQTPGDADKQGTTTVTKRPDEGPSSTYVEGITSMRARSLVGVVLSLAALVIGWRARKRAAAGIGNKGRNGAMLALVLAAIAIVLSTIHLSSAAGAAFGSGSGKAGAILALVLGLAGMLVSGSVFRQKKMVN